ncbi:hypothetical protein LCGC14_0723220 [marine sediment metagenome]|uniref:Uncharacterized protein n=1 Tax=marine sediment metagenome TaxID=412755 RepID=A0A0F9SX48_9ZZZZ
MKPSDGWGLAWADSGQLVEPCRFRKGHSGPLFTTRHAARRARQYVMLSAGRTRVVRIRFVITWTAEIVRE